ncbi:MAG: serine acetyltransferase [Treponema sp.]|nr:serine acetyltransferase [Treponema sp.]
MSIDSLVDKILLSYKEFGSVNCAGPDSFPNRENVVTVLQNLQSLIFPGYRTAETFDAQNIRYITGQRVNCIITMLTKEIQKALIYEVSRNTDKTDDPRQSHCFTLAETTAVALINELPEIRRTLLTDVQALFKGDPAAKSDEEVIVSYPGLEAIIVYRIAHFLYVNGVPVIPRIMSEHVHGKTGIDIHPGATIGESFFIDHGTGIVIGETSVIGKNVKIYQGVTLGALSVKKELMDKKRHPTVEDDVTIYANATILGGKTVIGKGSIIGGNTWITHSVPANSTISQDDKQIR